MRAAHAAACRTTDKQRTKLLKHSTISSQRYRDCMARLAGAVNLVATDGPAGRRALTVSAAVSISDNPPTVLICLNRNREENTWFAENGVFSLNTLGNEHLALARAFAGEGHLEMEERFALGEWQTLATGAPVLRGSRMSLDCRIIDARAVATHHVIMGEVTESSMDSTGDALIYLEREYRSL